MPILEKTPLALSRLTLSRVVLATTLLAVSLIGVTTASLSQDQPGAARDDRTYPPVFEDAQVEVYRTVGETQMKLWIFSPEQRQADQQGQSPKSQNRKKPAVVFFFGGGWNAGSPAQFAPQSRYLASRGVIGIVADYRVYSRHKTLPRQGVDDAKAALNWVRANAGRLGIDANRIAAAGGSSGGHLAAAAVLLPDSPPADEDPADMTSAGVTSAGALVLYNPSLVLASIPDKWPLSDEAIADMERIMGKPIEAMSPYHSIRAGLPPTVIFHGTADASVPFKTVELFCDAMKAAGNTCDLVGYEGEDHGFFNPGRGDGSAYQDTLRRLDGFLVSMGWIDAH